METHEENDLKKGGGKGKDKDKRKVVQRQSGNMLRRKVGGRAGLRKRDG